jgi:hypothetical protein
LNLCLFQLSNITDMLISYAIRIVSHVPFMTFYNIFEQIAFFRTHMYVVKMKDVEGLK